MAVKARNITLTTTPQKVAPSSNDDSAAGCYVHIIADSVATLQLAGLDTVLGSLLSTITAPKTLPSMRLMGDDEIWLSTTVGTTVVQVIETGVTA